MESTNRSSQVETVTISPVPESARRGRAIGLFPIWFGVQIMPLTLVTGVLGTTPAGLPLGWAILAAGHRLSRPPGVRPAAGLGNPGHGHRQPGRRHLRVAALDSGAPPWRAAD